MHTFRVYYTSNVGVFLCMLLIKVVLDRGQQTGFRKHPRLVCVVKSYCLTFVFGCLAENKRQDNKEQLTKTNKRDTFRF